MLLLNPQIPATFVDIIALFHYHGGKNPTSKIRIIYILSHTQGVIKGLQSWRELRLSPSAVLNSPKELYCFKFPFLELLGLSIVLYLLVIYISPRAFGHVYFPNSLLEEILELLGIIKEKMCGGGQRGEEQKGERGKKVLESNSQP